MKELRFTPIARDQIDVWFAQLTEDPDARSTLAWHLEQCSGLTTDDPHRWPLFDIFRGEASWRAAVAILGGVRYSILFTKQFDANGEVEPVAIWARKEDPETGEPLQ